LLQNVHSLEYQLLFTFLEQIGVGLTHDVHLLKPLKLLFHPGVSRS
jgi:hypothetical protein